MAEGSRARPALRFESLEVRRFLGLQRPDQSLHLGPECFSPGVTLVAGPNGSGKTTAGLALSAVLWPAASADPRGEVVASVSLGGRSWTAEVFGRVGFWRCDGRRSDGPPLVPGLEPERYRLALPELLRAEDRDLAACICRELGGGYSLVEAAQSLGFSAAPPLPRQAVQRLRQAREGVVEARREQAALQQLAGGLDGLRREAEAALQAARERDVVGALLDWRQSGRALAAARRQLAGFDPRCGRLREQDFEQWRLLGRELGQAEAGVAAARRALEQAEAGLAAWHDRPEPPTAAALRRARVLLQDLQSLEREGRQAECHLEGCRAREAAARGVLGERLEAEHIERLGRLQPDEGLAEAARSHLEASSRSAVLEHVRSLPVGCEATPDEGALAVWRQGLDVLGAWLAEPAVVVSSGARRRAWAVVGLVVLAGLAAAVPALLWRRWALLVPALCSLLAGWLLRPRQSAVAASRRPALEAAYAGLGLEAPVAWDAPGVLAASAELSRRCGLAEARLRLHREVQAVCRVLERDAAELQRHHESVRRGVADRLGVAFADEPLAAWHLVSRIAAWQDARDA
ncbi:MAG: hypothetical protein GX595_10925, partial [Lentisphaerae bacterium]|nr:hypothetical protein [Lentisphaerota bacterium]